MNTRQARARAVKRCPTLPTCASWEFPVTPPAETTSWRPVARFVEPPIKPEANQTGRMAIPTRLQPKTPFASRDVNDIGGTPRSGSPFRCPCRPVRPRTASADFAPEFEFARRHEDTKMENSGKSGR
jgi:hypothetical protein